MKLFRTLLSVIIILSACSKEEENVPAPTVTAAFVDINLKELILPKDSVVKIMYTVLAPGGITSITATVQYDSLVAVSIMESKTTDFKSVTTDNGILSYTSLSNLKTKISITVTDKKGFSNSALLTINPLLGESTNGLFFNIFGTGNSGFDIVGKATVSDTSASATIISAEEINNDSIPFKGSFKVVNGAEMTASTLKVYDQATAVSLVEAYKADSTRITMANPAKDNVFIVYKDNCYAIIKINSIIDGKEANKDNVTFNYKWFKAK